MSEMVERVARAIFDDAVGPGRWDNSFWREERDGCFRSARAAIAAMRPLTTDINGAIIALGASIGSDDPRSSRDVIGDMDIINAVWGAIIDAVLAEEASDV